MQILETLTLVREAAKTLDHSKMTQNWRDPRIKAALLLAPGWGWIFDKNDLNKVSIPVHIVAPQNDGVLVTENNARHFARSIPQAKYRVIQGKANHRIFISRPDAIKFPDLHRLLEDAPDVDRSQIQAKVAQEAVQFFQSSLKS